MLKKLLGKVLHSLEHSKHGGHRKYSSSHRGRHVHYSSSAGHRSHRNSSSGHGHSGGRYGHGYYKNRRGSSS
ncbi:MAG: hypothetical protein K6T94_00320 [Paenibacillus sp.]|nr:hypothetical protein [Paenibacillus sp.]